jgi:hypothetical protein
MEANNGKVIAIGAIPAYRTKKASGPANSRTFEATEGDS